MRVRKFVKNNISQSEMSLGHDFVVPLVRRLGIKWAQRCAKMGMKWPWFIAAFLYLAIIIAKKRDLV